MDEARLVAFLARGHRALQDTIPPRTRKSFAALMLDSKLWSSERLRLESAISRVGDCLNPQRGSGQSFRLSELWLWMHESGHHALFNAMADDLGYHAEPIPNEKRQQELLTRLDTRLAALADEFADIQGLREQLAGSRQPDVQLPAPEGVRFSRDDHEQRGF